MRILLSVVLLAVASLAMADEFTLYPTVPGTSVRDFSEPGFRVNPDRGTIQPTLPGTSVRDYSRPGYRIESFGGRKTLHPTIPGTSVRDYSEPSYIID